MIENTQNTADALVALKLVQRKLVNGESFTWGDLQIVSAAIARTEGRRPLGTIVKKVIEKGAA